MLTLSWGMLCGLAVAGAVVWFWQSSLGVRERANQAAMEACQRLHLQFLDGTVAFARLWPARGRDGRVMLRRTYVFDYTADSIDRRQGFVVLLGEQLESVGFARDAPPEYAPEEPDAPARDEAHAANGRVRTNVLDLDDWRSHPRRTARIPGKNERDGA